MTENRCRMCSHATFEYVSCVTVDAIAMFRYLIYPQPRPRNINDVMPMIGARFYSQLDATHLRNDVLEHALSRVSRSHCVCMAD